MLQIKDHEGNPVRHGWATSNGVRLHYFTAGQPPLITKDNAAAQLQQNWLGQSS
jgi:hypothetical protein